ncbi:MAG: transcriptional repressor [Ignavibacteriaceae bacterium]|nr:transcriptional repressor [Ignavibacteriaceae bacterium]
MKQILSRLKSSGLRVTNIRKDVLALLSESPRALSSHDLIEELHEKYDRVSVFRTINTFVEHGLIHQIPTSSDHNMYSLCRESCPEHTHRENHVHFYCSICGGIYCMSEIPPVSISLPDGFEETDREIILNGRCAECSRKQ